MHSKGLSLGWIPDLSDWECIEKTNIFKKSGLPASFRLRRQSEHFIKLLYSWRRAELRYTVICRLYVR